VRVEVVRSGGIAGITRRARLDTSELDAPERAAVERALRALPFPAHSEVPSHSDEFRYLVSLPDSGATAELWESELSPELKRAFGHALRTT
jgi:hypothetical protein